jgi:hypothetical protein
MKRPNTRITATSQCCFEILFVNSFDMNSACSRNLLTWWRVYAPQHLMSLKDRLQSKKLRITKLEVQPRCWAQIVASSCVFENMKAQHLFLPEWKWKQCLDILVTAWRQRRCTMKFQYCCTPWRPIKLRHCWTAFYNKTSARSWLSNDSSYD